MGKPISSFSHLSPHIAGPGRSFDHGVGSFGPHSGLVGEMYGGGDLLRSISLPTEADKPRIIELAVAAMEELVRIVQAGEPLWVPSEHYAEVLNEDEYLRTFPRGIGPKPLGLKLEASRDSAVVIMNHISLVDILMDVVCAVSSLFRIIICAYKRLQFSYTFMYHLQNQWSRVFCGIVSRSMTIQVLSTGVAGNYNGALQVVCAFILRIIHKMNSFSWKNQ